ncbi:uncharacterized protein LOC122368998 isoform X2 [Amphibalanus amphitrite]|uniref:uncharacterized protein LOC122368998 isoform X2 n=1 Tax=Amphibalanus amphitrite TaxID=1232801 RepID=UPI001C90F2BA|nr:uncharacterized protein LOC122368998 isoform X2 [Amphibalanus amphitrite]
MVPACSSWERRAGLKAKQPRCGRAEQNEVCKNFAESDVEERDAKPPGAAPATETSTELLTRLLGQQLELAARRDEQLTMLLQHIQQGAAAGARPVDGGGALAAASGGCPPAAAGGGSAPTASGGGGAPAATGGGSAPAAAAVTESVAAAAAVPPTVGSRQRICLPATGTPVPRLHSSASLIEFDTWRRKFDGYCLLTRVRELTTAEQKAALIAVLDDDWTRIVDFGLQLPADADLDSVLEAMQKYLRRRHMSSHTLRGAGRPRPPPLEVFFFVSVNGAMCLLCR